MLWKQDVDLGYCLPTASDEIEKEANQTENSEEDIEKLKALEELKNDKVRVTFDLLESTLNFRLFLEQRR